MNFSAHVLFDCLALLEVGGHLCDGLHRGVGGVAVATQAQVGKVKANQERC